MCESMRNTNHNMYIYDIYDESGDPGETEFARRGGTMNRAPKS